MLENTTMIGVTELKDTSQCKNILVDNDISLNLQLKRP